MIAQFSKQFLVAERHHSAKQPFSPFNTNINDIVLRVNNRQVTLIKRTDENKCQEHNRRELLT